MKKKNIFKKFFFSDYITKGQIALLFTLIILGVILSIGVGLTLLTIKEMQMAKNIEESAKALEAAHAGIEYALWEINKGDPINLSNFTCGTNSVLVGDAEYCFEISGPIDDPNEVKSIGKISSGNIQRALKIWSPESISRSFMDDLWTWEFDEGDGQYWCEQGLSIEPCCSRLTFGLPKSWAENSFGIYDSGAANENWSRVYIKNDLSFIPNNAKIISAKIFIYVNSVNPGFGPPYLAADMEIGSYFVPNDGWGANNNPATKVFNPVATDIFNTDTCINFCANSWLSWDITSDVKQEYNGDKTVSECLRWSQDNPNNNNDKSCFWINNILYQGAPWPYIEIHYVEKNNLAPYIEVKP